MRIKKTSNTRALAGKVVNTNSNSTIDAYSCDYLNGTVLYENQSGNASDVVFTEENSGYKKLEIYYYGHDRGSGEIAICDHIYNNNIVLVSQGFSSETTRHYIYTTRYTVSSTGLTINQKRLTTIYAASITNADSNGIYITKVIGYK